MLVRMNHPAARNHMHDASVPNADPTGTATIRRRFRTLIDLRWRKLVKQLRNVIMTQDVLGLNPAQQSAVGFALAGLPIEARSRSFQAWLDQTLSRVVLETDTAYLDPMIEAAYRKGLLRAQRLTRNVIPPDMRDVISNLQQLTLMEMQGIVEAVSQNLVRIGANAQLDKLSQRDTLRMMTLSVQRIGMTRSRTTVETLVVKTHAQASLDTFQAAGVLRVGSIPETVRPVRFIKRLGDAVVDPAPTREGTSRTTIARILREERSIERRFRSKKVEIETAGDDLVCPECEELAADGPYSIDEARSLIPAHPNCRCAFIPEDEAGFGDDEED